MQKTHCSISRLQKIISKGESPLKNGIYYNKISICTAIITVATKYQNQELITKFRQEIKEYAIMHLHIYNSIFLKQTQQNITPGHCNASKIQP